MTSSAKSNLPQTRAAEYVRMSRERQEYSIPAQQKAIRQYAQGHGYSVVRTYADRGKSGLTLARRDALAQMLLDVADVHRDFDLILVYDVSRWGRFQDTDESAYYEFHCRKHHVRVEYCVEAFSNDGSPLASIVKSIKRAMAAEFSRELSARVSLTMRQMTQIGHFHGGMPG